MKAVSTNLRPSRRYLLLVLVFALALYVILPQFGDFRSSWHLLSHPDPIWVAVAAAFTATTYLAATSIYYLLAFRPLRYFTTLLVELAAMFINRLVPAGIGAVGVNFLYLRRQKHSSTQAATVVALNNICGFVGHNLLLAILFLMSAGDFVRPTTTGNRNTYLWIGLLVAMVLGIVFARWKFRNALADIIKHLISYRQRPGRVIGALLSSMALTFSYVMALYACAMALSVDLTPLSAMLILTLGVSAGAIVPSPGGLGPFEAGIVAGLAAYHVDSATALAIALLFRLITYWLPLGVGAVAFVVSERKRLFERS